MKVNIDNFIHEIDGVLFLDNTLTIYFDRKNMMLLTYIIEMDKDFEFDLNVTTSDNGIIKFKLKNSFDNVVENDDVKYRVGLIFELIDKYVYPF